METFGLLSFLLLVLHTSADRPIPRFVKEIIHVEEKMIWTFAKQYCLSNSGQFYVASEKNDLKNLTGSANQLSWTGLLSVFSLWNWVDETKTSYFNLGGECAAMIRDGYWYSTTCDNKLYFVCKKVSGHLVLVRERKTWQEAKQKCETNHVGLATIHGEADNLAVHAVLDNTLIWIGLARDPLKDTWRWVNNVSVTYSSLSAALFCMVIDLRGLWHDRVCFEEHPFICFRKVNNILEFKLVSENKIWREAQSHCKLLNMNLVMVKTQAELIALVTYINRILIYFESRLSFWMGLYNNPWVWFGSEIQIQNWNRMQPDNLSFKNKTISPEWQACGASKDGELFDESCNDPLPFFCTATVRSMILVSEPKSWMEALKHCRDRYVDLASLSSVMEQHTAKNKVENVQSNYVWIGLNFLAGSWIWVYGDDIQYVNWVNGDNLQCPVARRCGALTVANGKWEARACEERLEFLCFQA